MAGFTPINVSLSPVTSDEMFVVHESSSANIVLDDGLLLTLADDAQIFDLDHLGESGDIPTAKSSNVKAMANQKTSRERAGNDNLANASKKRKRNRSSCLLHGLPAVQAVAFPLPDAPAIQHGQDAQDAVTQLFQDDHSGFAISWTGPQASIHNVPRQVKDRPVISSTTMDEDEVQLLQDSSTKHEFQDTSVPATSFRSPEKEEPSLRPGHTEDLSFIEHTGTLQNGHNDPKASAQAGDFPASALGETDLAGDFKSQVARTSLHLSTEQHVSSPAVEPERLDDARAVPFRDRTLNIREVDRYEIPSLAPLVQPQRLIIGKTTSRVSRCSYAQLT